MKPRLGQSNVAPVIGAESSAVAWVAVGIALVMTVASLLAAALV